MTKRPTCTHEGFGRHYNGVTRCNNCGHDVFSVGLTQELRITCEVPLTSTAEQIEAAIHAAKTALATASISVLRIDEEAAIYAARESL